MMTALRQQHPFDISCDGIRFRLYAENENEARRVAKGMLRSGYAYANRLQVQQVQGDEHLTERT